MSVRLRLINIDIVNAQGAFFWLLWTSLYNCSSMLKLENPSVHYTWLWTADRPPPRPAHHCYIINTSRHQPPAPSPAILQTLGTRPPFASRPATSSSVVSRSSVMYTAPHKHQLSQLRHGEAVINIGSCFCLIIFGWAWQIFSFTAKLTNF